jgi:hypothetical protein
MPTALFMGCIMGIPFGDDRVPRQLWRGGGGAAGGGCVWEYVGDFITCHISVRIISAAAGKSAAIQSAVLPVVSC